MLFCRKTSGVDGRPLDGVHSVRLQQDAEFESDGRCIKCTEVEFPLREGKHAKHDHQGPPSDANSYTES